MLVPMGKGSGTLTEPHHTPSPKAPQTSPTATSSPSLPPSSTLPPVADEPASPIGDDSQGEACPTDSGLKAEQDRANITKTSTLPSDSTPRVTSLAADEGSMQQQLNELTDLYTRLQRQQDEMALKITAQDLEISQLKARVKLLEDKEGGGIAQSEEVSVAEVPTGSGSIHTASPPGTGVPTGGVPTGSGSVPTTSLIFTTATVATPYTKRKGKEKMVESETPKKRKLQKQMDVQMARQLEEEMERDAQRMNEQIARDAEITRIHAEEELQIMIDGLDINNETVAKYLQEYYQFAAELPIGERIELISNLVKYQDNYAKVLKYQTQQRKPLSRKQQKEFYISVLRSRAGIRLEQDSAKKVKTLKEVPEENLKEMMQLIPIKEVYVEALQVKYPIIDWEVHTKWERSYWKIIRLGGSTASYQFFVDLLKHFEGKI
uniref:Uncharacterized protein n=1 Tax=Tanacetum cinerariifolium TaxID=118510 RepID=A0A699IE59_TANCI|nr:hypothetical protein [Tanacetum cinerariifolium]